MKLYRLPTNTDISIYLKSIGVSDEGVRILKDKSTLHKILIKDLNTFAGNILKQDALSIGADLAVPRGTIMCATDTIDALLIATTKQLKLLIKKSKLQPFGLKGLSLELKHYIKDKNHKIKIMGVINANDDSFYSTSRFMGDKAVSKIIKMIDDGADIIDIGGVSSRPGSQEIDSAQELMRVKPIIDKIYQKKLYKKVKFSIDSYTPKVIEYALKRGFSIVNDITGLKSDKVCKLISKYSATAIIMHMRGTPKDMQKSPYYDNVLVEISDFFDSRIKKAKKFEIKDIILDVGIGFGKRLEDNLLLINHLEDFTKFGYEILMGASRKSMIDMIIKTKVEDRLSGTIAINLKSIQNGASIIRVHDVAEHYQAIKITKAIEEIKG
jgi:dihydropteroate synthase